MIHLAMNPMSMLTAPLTAAQGGATDDLESLLELMLGGGPMMVPIGLCSIVALAFAVERWLRFRPALLGSKRFGRDVVAAVRDGGVESGLQLAASKKTPLARILALALERADDPYLDREKAVGDYASNQLRRLANNLRPLLLVWLIAPLLGLLGTVWGMIEAFVSAFKVQKTTVKGIGLCGAMADLVPPHLLAEATGLLRAPYLNSFGSTETGLPPASRALIPAGETPIRLSKQQNAFCEVRLVDPSGCDVAAGAPGELAIRGPTLFSGYWQAEETNQRDFRGGWFHMGDVFRRNPDGSLDFVDRAKYMIKSGGENVYPAEIERVLMTDPRITEAAVVRAPDAKWGEIAVAFVSRRDETVTEADLLGLCRRDLAAYKCPRRFRFIDFSAFPRSTSGKVQRHELEARLSNEIEPPPHRL